LFFCAFSLSGNLGLVATRALLYGTTGDWTDRQAIPVLRPIIN